MTQLKLSPIELEILKKIIELSPSEPARVAEELNISLGKVTSLLPVLEAEHMVEKTVSTQSQYYLTSRGKSLIKGLPERVILDKLIEMQKIHMKKLGNIFDIDRGDLNAGIGILKKNSIITINKGEIIIADAEKAQTFSQKEQEALQALQAEKTIEPEIGELLKKRGLAEKQDKTSITITARITAGDLKNIQVAEEVSKVTPELLVSGEWKNITFKPYNMKVKPRRIHPGKYHPYKHFHDHVRTKLVGLGFKEMKGPLVEQEFWNFDTLYSPQDHPSREDTDIFLIDKPTHGKLPKENYVKNVQATHENGWQTGSKGYGYKWDPRKAARLLLRPQGTAISARTLNGLQTPAKYFSLAKCFRPDSIDATHGVEFYQAEGIVCDPSITFRDLLGILKVFATDIAGASEVSFRPDYYPFTSPSVELSAKHPILGRIEFGGAGIFRPEVTQPFGIKHPVIAWGIGVDRLFMVKQEIKDIRELFSQNLTWLRETKTSSGIQVE